MLLCRSHCSALARLKRDQWLIRASEHPSHMLRGKWDRNSLSLRKERAEPPLPWAPPTSSCSSCPFKEGRTAPQSREIFAGYRWGRTVHCQSYESTLVGVFWTFPPLTSILANIVKQACKWGCLKPARFHQLPLISRGCQQSSTSSPEEVLCKPAELQMRVLPPSPRLCTLSTGSGCEWGPGCRDEGADPTRASQPSGLFFSLLKSWWLSDASPMIWIKNNFADKLHLPTPAHLGPHRAPWRVPKGATC